MALAQRIRRGVLFSLLAPWMVLTLVLDRAIAPLRRRRSGGPNTCRVSHAGVIPPAGSAPSWR
jgi:hypothetical protein